LSRLEISLLERAKSRFGEVVLDPDQWPSLMDDLCAATATTGAALLQADIRTPDVPTTPGVSHLFKVYFENNLHVTDVRAAKGVPLVLSGKRALCDQDLFPSEAVMLADPLYATLSEFGFRWFSALSFRAGPAHWVVSMQRTIREGMFEKDHMKALASLSQSLTDVATLSHAVGRQALLGTLNAFDLIKEAAISLGTTGRVLDMNSAAVSMFDTDFRVRNGRLYMRDAEAIDAIEGLLNDERDDRLDPRESARVFFARRPGRRPLSIKAIPVHGVARSPFLGARLILTFRDLDGIRRPASEALSDAFSLTAAEAKVASMVAGGAGPEQISDELRVSRETVRNQIKIVFSKTGTHRQNELAALVLRIQD
jgi:DNA-binding CsgD family transcriptional regulator